MAQLFVGVWPPKKVVQAIAAYPRTGDGWTDERQWLVNVRPLSYASGDVTAALVKALRFELDGMPKPKAALGTVKHGEWLRVTIDGLDELRDVVFEATMPIVPVSHPKSMPWEVAIVLRRSRSPIELVRPLAGSWTVGEVVLAEGSRRGGSYHYETVESIPLG
jgi:hypothetical protein